jgi:hypothetical protein
MRLIGFITAATCIICPAPVNAQLANLDRESINFVLKLRNADGGYAGGLSPAGAPTAASLRATAAALRAVKYLGGQPAAAADTARFVENCIDKKTGGFGDQPGQPTTAVTTAIGALAAVELKLPAESYRDGVVRFLSDRAATREEIRMAAAAFESLGVRPAKADDWLRQIAVSGNMNGTFGSGRGLARETGGTAVTILRLGGKLDHRDAILETIRSGQRLDGGFGPAEREGSDLESTYRVMRAFVMLKEMPSDPAKLRAFVAKCRQPGGGYSVSPGQPGTATGTYYAAIVLHWLDQH